MTSLLLDTHAYVWAITTPDRLGRRAAEALREPTNVLLVSAATVWEMAIKQRAGKWPEAEPLLADHAALSARLGASPLHISWPHARRAGALSWAHTDPFDRMLAAQAMIEDVALVTQDLEFENVSGLRTVW